METVDLDPIGPALSEAEIAAFEAGARFRIPPQLRAFLLRLNGAAPRRMIQPGPEADTDLACIFQLYRRGRGDRAPDMVGAQSGDLLWFAGDSGGGQFGIAHTGPAFGRIFWCDLPHIDIEAPNSGDCREIAPSFDAFIDSLVPFDP